MQYYLHNRVNREHLTNRYCIIHRQFCHLNWINTKCIDKSTNHLIIIRAYRKLMINKHRFIISSVI